MVLLRRLLNAARPGTAFGDAACSSATSGEVPRVTPACLVDLRTQQLQFL